MTRKEKALAVLRKFFIFCIHKVIWKRRLKLSEDKAFNLYKKKSSTIKKSTALFLTQEDEKLKHEIKKVRPSTAPNRMSRQMKDVNYYYSNYSKEKTFSHQNSVSSSAFATVSQMMLDNSIQTQTVSKNLTYEIQENNHQIDSKTLAIDTSKN